MRLSQQVIRLDAITFVIVHKFAQAVNHFFTDFYTWRRNFRISAHHVPEIDVKELPIFREHQVIQVPIANPKQIRDD